MGYIVRGTAAEGKIRFFSAVTTDIVEEARKIHNTLPTASAALGRMLTAGSIMGAMLKGDDSVTLSINGGGPAGKIIVVSNAMGNVKGYIDNPSLNLPLSSKGKLDVGSAVGKNGLLNVVKDTGLKQPYTGQVPIQTGEIGDDLTYYLTVSEQVPSAVALGVLVDKDISIKAAGGYIIQMMPGSDEFLADIVTYRLEEIPPVTTSLSEGKSPEDIMNMLFDDMDIKFLDKMDINYLCDCSRKRVEKALIALGKDELEKLIEEEEKTQVECHFCDKKYVFNRDELRKLIE